MIFLLSFSGCSKLESVTSTVELAAESIKQQKEFSLDSLVETVISYIQAGNIAAIEEMLCPEIRLETENLQEKLTNLVAFFSNGIDYYTWEDASSTASWKSGILTSGEKSAFIHIHLMNMDVTLTINFKYVNVDNPDARGINNIRLYEVPHEDGTISSNNISFHLGIPGSELPDETLPDYSLITTPVNTEDPKNGG
jgi:hypothetical protein